MGLLSLFAKANPDVQRLPSGSLTVDREGRILASTVSSTTPNETLELIGANILQLFREARNARMEVSQLTLNFASLQITARELRGGAIIFLQPKHALMSPLQKSEIYERH